MGASKRDCVSKNDAIRPDWPEGYILLVKAFTLGCLMVILSVAQPGLAMPAKSSSQLQFMPVTLMQAQPASSQGKPVQAQPASSQGKPVQAQPASSQGKPVQAQPASSQGKPVQAQPASSQGKPVQAQPASSQGKPVQAQPASSQGKPVQAQPASSQGKPVQAQPASSQGKPVQARPASSQGKPVQARPASSQGKPVQARPASSQGKLAGLVDDVARVRSMYQEVRAIYREAARMLSGAKGYDQRKPIIVLQRHCSKSLGRLSGKLKAITLRRADPAIVAAAKRDHGNCRKRFDKLS